MKYIPLALVLLIFLSCKQDSETLKTTDKEDLQVVNPVARDHTKTSDLDIKPLDKSISIELKQQQLIEKEDEIKELNDLIINKTYIVDKKDYSINFNYPLLNENLQPKYRNFNEFIEAYYVNISQTEKDIIESKLLCDSIAAKSFREERLIDYKVYNVNDRLLSLLFYKENFYSGAMHPVYSFDCFNYDLETGVFMSYEDFFASDSEVELIQIINETINKSIREGDIYYDCWEVASTDFLEQKNNFVFNDDIVEFYFDDCVICPSYTGTYSVTLELTDLISVLRKYHTNPLEI